MLFLYRGTSYVQCFKKAGQANQQQFTGNQDSMTLVNLLRMSPQLEIYQDKNEAELLFKGFKVGFNIPSFDGLGCVSLENLKSVTIHKNVVHNKI